VYDPPPEPAEENLVSGPGKRTNDGEGLLVIPED